MYWLILIPEFILLYLISRALTQTLFLFFFWLSRNKNVALSATTLLLFPGTVIHELAHLFTAEVLGVRTGRLTLVPEPLSQGQSDIRTGSVSIAQTGPFRRAAIGIAPVVIGLAALSALAYFLPDAWAQQQTPVLILIGYLLFTISNSLFSSPEDLVGFWPLAITVSLFAAAAWIAGFRLELTGQALEAFLSITGALAHSLALVLAINIVLLVGLRFLLAMGGYSRLRTSKKAD